MAVVVSLFLLQPFIHSFVIVLFSTTNQLAEQIDVLTNRHTHSISLIDSSQFPASVETELQRETF